MGWSRFPDVIPFSEPDHRTVFTSRDGYRGHSCKSRQTLPLLHTQNDVESMFWYALKTTTSLRWSVPAVTVLGDPTCRTGTSCSSASGPESSSKTFITSLSLLLRNTQCEARAFSSSRQDYSYRTCRLVPLLIHVTVREHWTLHATIT